MFPNLIIIIIILILCNAVQVYSHIARPNLQQRIGSCYARLVRVNIFTCRLACYNLVLLQSVWTAIYLQCVQMLYATVPGHLMILSKGGGNARLGLLN